MMLKNLKYYLLMTTLTVLYIFRRPLVTRSQKMLAGLQETTGAPSGAGNSAVNDPSDLDKATWKKALKRTKQALKDKDLAASAAALSYYATLSFFPVVIGLASLYVVIAGNGGLEALITNLRGLVPESIFVVLDRQLSPIAESATKAGLALGLSVAAVLWTTSGGIQNLVRATDKAYEVKETRKFVKLRLVSLALSVLLLLIGMAIMALLVLQASALRQLGMPDFLANLFPILRWPVLVVLISILLSAVYRYAPNRDEPHWQWVSWGATAAALLWLVATALFFVYVQNFGNYTKTYGTFAGIIVLMIWFNISSLIILLGAQVNKKLEEVAPKGSTQ